MYDERERVGQTIYFDPETKDRLAELARRDRRSFSNYVAFILEQHVEENFK